MFAKIIEKYHKTSLEDLILGTIAVGFVTGLAIYDIWSIVYFVQHYIVTIKW